MTRFLVSKNTAVAVFGCVLFWALQLNGKPRVIVILQEGLGHEITNAARMYSEDSDLWDWRLDHNWKSISLSTLPLSKNTEPDGSDPDELSAYDSLKAWNGSLINPGPTNTSIGSAKKPAGYKWLIEQATDRMQVASAFNSGIATYNTSINWLTYPQKSGSPMPAGNLILEKANRSGMKTGIVSDMPFTHPTNTILAGVRNESNEEELDRFAPIFEFPHLNLFVATGHPKYNELGQALSKPQYKFCSQGYWKDLRSLGRQNGWEVIFGDDNLMGINSKGGNTSEKRLVITQFGDTTSTQAISSDSSGLVNNLANSLRFQTKMALSYLNRNDDGFVLIVHMGRLPYLLENNFQKEAVEEVINTFEIMTACEEWVESNGGWNDTTLMVSSLYEYGLLWGSDSSSFPFSQVNDRGKKRVPGFRINNNGPTATLAPLLSRGSLAKKIEHLATNEDPIYGKFLHITELHRIITSF